MDVHAQEGFRGSEAAPPGGLADAVAPGVGCDQTSEAQQPVGDPLARERHLWRRRLGGGRFGPAIADASPFAPMAQLCTRRERVMESFLYRRCGPSPERSSGQPPGNEGAAPSQRAESAPVRWSPSVNVRESGDSIFISVDLPGVRKEDVQIKADKEGIEITGERRAGRESMNGTDPCYRVAECSHGGFHRIIPLPQTALIEAARAGLHEGVLEITIPLRQNRRTRQIEIEC